MDGTIIIMDSSSYERQKMLQIIEKIGNFNIIEVASINQLKLPALELSDLKLILMDLLFPTESDGFEALRRIRFGNNDVPVIIVTKLDKHELKTEALKYFVNDYVIKPYSVKRLESSIKSFVRVVKNFYYNTDRIKEIKMTFDDYVVREIKYSKRTKNSLSIILITILQIRTEPIAGLQITAENKLSIFEIAVQKAKETLRATDTIVLNQDRDIIIVLSCTDEDGARLVCDKIGSKMEPEFKKINANLNEYIYPVYVTYPKDGDSFQMLMETAFKKVASKEMLENIVSISAVTRMYAEKSYSKYKKLQ